MTESTTSSHGVSPPGYRLPTGTHVGRVRLQVADLNRSVEYYQRVLGFRVLDRSNEAATLGPEAGEPLIELRERLGARAVPRRGLLGLYHFAVLLPDRPSLGRLVAYLGRLGEYAGMSDHLVSEAVYLTDPDGLGIEVYADRPRNQWRWEKDQLAMATNPLDVHSVVASAGGEPWTGMPAGTTMGHVHLHVGDIDRAEAFYHAALGLDKVVWGYPGALFMSAGGYHHHLGVNTWAAGAPPATEADARLIEWQLVLPDAESVEAAVKSIQAAGFKVESDGNDALTSDPWSTALRLRSAA